MGRRSVPGARGRDHASPAQRGSLPGNEGDVRSRGVHRDTAGGITLWLCRYIHRAIGYVSRKRFGDRRLHESSVPHNTDSTHSLALAIPVAPRSVCILYISLGILLGIPRSLLSATQYSRLTRESCCACFPAPPLGHGCGIRCALGCSRTVSA